MNIRSGVKSIGAGFLIAAISSIAWSQEKTGLPEFFGFYALDGVQNVAIYEGQGSEGAKSTVVNGYSIPQNSKFQDTRPQIATSARFLLFYSNSGEMVQSMSLYRLPVVRHIIETQTATAFSPPTRQVVDSPNVSLLARTQELAFKLLAKPVPNQPQMVELVASPKLTPGLYVVEYSPNGKDGWFATFAVTSASEVGTPYCLDLILPGGPGGLFFRANSELAANVPLLAPNDYSQCDSSSQASGNPSTVAAAESNTSSPRPDAIPWTDPATRLTWTSRDNGEDISLGSAVDYCKNLKLGGYANWRLPEVDELKGLHKWSSNDKLENSGLQPDDPNLYVHIKGGIKLSGVQWSNTWKSPTLAFVIDFSNGIKNVRNPQAWGSGSMRALCVRNP